MSKITHNYKQVKAGLVGVRKPYYQIQDGMWELSDVIKKTGDAELIELLESARAKVFEFEEVLSRKVNWD